MSQPFALDGRGSAKLSSGSLRFPLDVLNTMYELDLLPGLTQHEYAVVNMILSGMTNREIADRLGCGEQTLKNAVRVILRKTGTRSRTRLISKALAETGFDAQRQTHVSCGIRKGQATGGRPADLDAENQAKMLPGLAFAQGFAERERQIIGMIVAGMTNAEIGAELGLGKQMISNAVSSILKKTGARSRAHLATMVLSSGGSVHSDLARALYYVRDYVRKRNHYGPSGWFSGTIDPPALDKAMMVDQEAEGRHAVRAGSRGRR
jgi:DNA-binding NarL/FixJ family response regulator